MRIATNTTSQALAFQLQKLTARQTQLQSQTATGQRITNPSDDPAAMARVLHVQSEKEQLQQFARNNGKATEISQVTYSAVSQFKDLSNRAGEIATLGTGILNSDSAKAYTAEIDQMIEQGVQVANTRHSGDYIFGGEKNDAAPFAVTRDVNGKISSVAYAGSADAAQFRIAEGTTISPYTNGATNGQFATFLNKLVALRDGLATQNQPALSAVRQDLESSEDSILNTVSDIGAVQSRIEAMAKQNEVRFMALENLNSKEVDADLAQTIVKLTQNQNAYQAALQSGAKILSMSLMDYLR